METRAMAIAFFYAIGTALGGITGPLLFGKLIEGASKKDPGNMLFGYGLAATLMILAGIVAAFLAVEAAQKNLEDIAKPLTAEDAELAEQGLGGDGEMALPDRDRDRDGAREAVDAAEPISEPGTEPETRGRPGEMTGGTT
jgi:MFS family permease